MFRGFRKQLRCALQGQRHADSPVVHKSEVQHRQRIARIRSLLIQFRGIDQILLDTVAHFITHPQITLARSVFQLR